MSSFLQLNDSRKSSILGMQMLGEHKVAYAPDYTYMEIPILHLEVYPGMTQATTVDVQAKAKYVKVVPACTLALRGRDIVEIEPNPALAEYGPLQGSYYLHPGAHYSQSVVKVPVFHLNLHKSIDIADIPYAIRIYLRT